MAVSAEPKITAGLALGPYPQRLAAEITGFDRAVRTLTGRFERWRRGRPAAFDTIVARIDAEAEGLPRLSDEDLRARARVLRGELAGSGLAEGPVARAFALVREAAARRLGKRPYDVQLVGGWLLMTGFLAEMETGEGKTLTAGLPACVAALAGVPVHLVTVNDYLVERDAGLLTPLYEFFGLSVGTVAETMDFSARQAAYRADIVYCSNKTLVFDYLRDRLTLAGNFTPTRLQLERLSPHGSPLARLLLRGLHYAIVDEADSVLVDEARTPLILSKETSNPSERLVYQQALAVAERLRPGRDYLAEAKSRQVVLTAGGRARLAETTAELGGIWQGRRRAEEWVRQALAARAFYHRDQQYLVREGKVLIVDEFTGRVMADRSWERGLHQMIETKEGLELSGSKETLARISYQQFFGRYLRLAGMTGTAREVADELWSVYRLNTVRVPTHRPSRRLHQPPRVFPGRSEKLAALAKRITERHAEGRPVLVGTRSVAASEDISQILRAAGLAHQVLNARQDAAEAEIVGAAGQPGRITVATNMAGRGTDIQLGEGVDALGGLHVIATEMHEAGRIDRQLFGRCARQGDPGSCELFLSLDDELLTAYCSPLLRAWLGRLLRNGPRPLGERLCLYVAKAAQRAAERHHARIRQQTLRLDEKLKTTLAFSGTTD